MNKRFSILVGIIMILMGGLALAFNLVVLPLGWGLWRLWPLVVVSVGLLFVLSPLLARGKRGWGALFIPGAPILTTGVILLFTSVFAMWNAWEWLWPLEVLAVAVGFLLAAIYMRTIWLLIPAIIIGANGLLFQFCALTGWWSVWAVLWTVEPLAIGLSFLVVSAARRSSGLLAAGLVMCGLAGLGLAGSLTLSLFSGIFPVWWLFKLVVPVTLILGGFLILILGLIRRPSMPILE